MEFSPSNTAPVPGVPLFGYDPTSAEANANPAPIYAQMRRNRLCFWPGPDFYVVSRMADAKAVLKDPRLTPDPRAAGLPAPEAMMPESLRGPIEGSFQRLGAEDHARVRRAVAPAFAPAAIAKLRPAIQAIIDEAFEQHTHEGVLDGRAFAEHIPVRAIAAMMDIPMDEHEAFFEFANNLSMLHDPAMTPERFATVAPVVVAGLARIEALVAARREQLGDDLLSTLLRAEAQGDGLSNNELLGLVAMLINGGILTTTHFFTFVFKDLLCVPEREAAIRAQRELIPTALEELLRHDSFGKSGTLRYLTEDAEVAGVELPRGSRVMVFFPAVYLDEEAFEDAARFDPARKPKDNLGYGYGRHFCTGAALARLESEVFVHTALDRFAGFELAEPVAFGPSPVVRDIVTLRVRTRS